ncbi:MAG: hypothetical protein KAV87_19735 [Desulfobacteraceae bacterium]|nr:hypothetical protein [Desulfobacteraceae bacterium]
MNHEAPSKLQGVQVAEWLGAFCFTTEPKRLVHSEALIHGPHSNNMP